MQNTTKKSRSHLSQMSLTVERELIVTSEGSLNMLGKLVEDANINIDTQEIMNSMHYYIDNLTTENQKLIFKAFYLRRMSIFSIRDHYGFKRITDVERPLKSATVRYLNMLKADYGIK